MPIISQMAVVSFIRRLALLCPEVAGGWAMGVADDGLDTGD